MKLLEAAHKGDILQAEQIVSLGTSVDFTDNQGRTALMLASGRGHVDMVRFLVEHGAAVDGRDSSDGRTPLMLAACEGHLNVIRFLVEHGAAVDAHDKCGATPLMRAAREGHWDVVRFLVEHRADVDASDSDGRTPLMRAAREGHWDVVRFLVEHGADVDASDSDGRTPLMRAAKSGYLDMVRFLVQQGANPNFTSPDGHTAIGIATKFGRHYVAQFLLPFVQYHDRSHLTEQVDEHLSRYLNIPYSWLISPFEIEVEPFVVTFNVGGDYRGKWLDADVVVKLFIDDIASSTFVEEVRLWHRLRHPNILKLYGVCNSFHHLFVCEYASNGSLSDYLKSCDTNCRTPWKFLHEAALGLEYLHERKIVHGNLRGTNILIGSDGLAKLSEFKLSASSSEGRLFLSSELVRWAAPECVRGKQLSFASDVYSLGMCIVEAVSGKLPYSMCDKSYLLSMMKRDKIVVNYLRDQLSHSSHEQRDLVKAMCAKDPQTRLQVSAVVDKLKQFAEMEAKSVSAHSEPDLLVDLDEFDRGKMSSLWIEVKHLSAQSENSLYRQIYHDLILIFDTLKGERHPWSTLLRFHDLLAECLRVLDAMSQQNRVRRLSATRARDYSVHGLRRRIYQLLQRVRPQDHDADTRETEWKRLCRDQVEVFVSEASEACVMLSSVDSEEGRSALVAVLRAELRNSDGKYTDKQLEVLQKTCDEIVSNSLEDSRLATTPEWFIPWFELEMNEMMTLGEGGFASVIKAKWLDSDVVVKKLEISEKDAANVDKKREMRKMFEREVNIWFGLSHPHVVQLFGACHVGRPFFVCELAPNGTLVEYLRHHPDELWSKLREAALGVQYLHARGIVHGDLKGNNILVGSDGQAKVTDFGLSDVFGDDSTDMMVSEAMHWLAPECMLMQKPTFASDIYSLAMCIIEALRVTNGDDYTLPWGKLPNATVKFNVTRRHHLPPRPQSCSDEAWTLIEHMCKSGPANRMLIMTVVDELKKLADWQGDLSSEADEMFDNIGEVRRSPSSVADDLAEMKSWTGKCDAMHGWEGGVLENIHQLLWDRLHQVGSQLMPDGEDIIDFKAPIIDFSTLVEQSKQRTQEALGITGDIPLIKFTELALGGYALHRRLDKFMAAHADKILSSPLHNWMSACSTYTGECNSLLPDRTNVESKMRFRRLSPSLSGPQFHLANQTAPPSATMIYVEDRYNMVNEASPLSQHGLFSLQTPAAAVKGLDTGDVTLAVSEAEIHTKSTRSMWSQAAELLVALYSLVSEIRVSQEMWEDLVKSVEMLLPHLTRMIDEGKISATAALTDYKALLIQIRDFLEIHTQKKLIPRLAGHWKVKDTIKTFYVERDRIVERMGLEFQEKAANCREHGSNRIEEIMLREQRIEEQAAKEFEELQNLIELSFKALQNDIENGITVAGSEVMAMLFDIKYQIKYNQEQSDNERKVLEVTMNKLAEAKGINKIPSLSSWYISRADIRFETSPFATSETRSLHLGKLSSGAKVAVKVVNAAEDDTENRDLFNKEVTKWYPLCNPHVLPLYGANNATTPLLFVLRFAEKGNFNEYLPKNRHLFWKVFLDAARGLAYLHSRRPPIVHANLKCSNLLVLADGTGVVSDFLFAFSRENTQLSFQIQTPSTRWKAPECLQFRNSGNARVESDIYSLGMCLIEGLTGKQPFDGLEERVIYEKIRAGELPSPPDGNINDESWTLIKAMCAQEFQDRMTLREVIRSMEVLAEKERVRLGSLECSCSSGSCSECGKPIKRSK